VTLRQWASISGTFQDRSAFIFRVKQFLKMKALRSFETSGISCPKKQRYISEAIKNFTLKIVLISGMAQ
jgi:hypothetical protein